MNADRDKTYYVSWRAGLLQRVEERLRRAVERHEVIPAVRSGAEHGARAVPTQGREGRADFGVGERWDVAAGQDHAVRAAGESGAERSGDPRA